MDANQVVLTGNLTRDVELIQTPTGRSRAGFTIASNRVYKQANGEQKKDTMFTRIIAWGNLAGICARYLHKGSKVLVIGRLTSREYESEPGKKSRVFEIVADQVNFLSGTKTQNLADANMATYDNVASQEPF